MPQHSVSIEFLANSGRLMRETDTARRGISRFAAGVKGELGALKNAALSLQGTLAGLGLSVGLIRITRESALLDKQLTQIGQTAAQSAGAVSGLRAELHAMARRSGQDVRGLIHGFNSLIQSGQSWKSALESTRAISTASAVTGAGGDVLAGGLSVGATAYAIDLEQPGKALELLDKMVVAGRLGNAELENLSSIFARVGVNAASAGMGFEKTLAFIETLSTVERQPERLATLADSTLRLFTNLDYAKKAQKATGVAFFDAKTGGRRDPVQVLKELQARYAKLTSDAKRAGFIDKAFGQVDLDTIRGLRMLFSGDTLGKVDTFAGQITEASGTLKKDFDAATDNLIDQAGRLKAVLTQAADGFVKPMKSLLTDWIQWGLDQKKFSGEEMIAGATGLGVTALLAARYGPKLGGLFGKMLGDAGSVTAGIATGKALEKATGVFPVFVTNWPAAGWLSPQTIPGKPGSQTAKTGGSLGMLGTLGTMGLMGAAAGTLAAPAFIWSTNEVLKSVEMDIGSMVVKWNEIAEAQKHILEVFRGERDWNTGEQKQPITINMTIDDQRRVTTETNNADTTVKTSLPRGEFK